MLKTESVVTEETQMKQQRSEELICVHCICIMRAILYIPAVNPEDRLIFDTAELKDHKYVGKQHNAVIAVA